MAKTVTPSKPASNAQIGKVTDKLSTALRSARFPGDLLQQITERKGDAMTAELVAVVRRHVETISDMFTRVVHVDKTRSAIVAIEATGRKMYLTDSIVATIPNFSGGETPVTFFKVGKTISNERLAKEYANRGLKPAHPNAVAKVNEDDPTFADDHPHATIWGGSSCATFFRWRDERHVLVYRNGYDWSDVWVFAGVPAS